MEEQKITIKELVQSEKWKMFSHKLELYSSIILVGLLVLFLTNNTDLELYGTMSIIVWPTLAISSYFIGFLEYKSESKLMSIVFYKIYGYGLSLGFITILFLQQNWSAPIELMLGLSVVCISISLVLGLREKLIENKNEIDWKYFARIIVASVPMIYFLINRF